MDSDKLVLFKSIHIYMYTSYGTPIGNSKTLKSTAPQLNWDQEFRNQ